MSIIYKIAFFLVLLNPLYSAQNKEGEKIFKTYCWGCHHETSMAFGPSFKEIASKRTKGEIQGHIIDPKSTYEQLGYKRTVMPSFKDKLSFDEVEEISNFILFYKGE